MEVAITLTKEELKMIRNALETEIIRRENLNSDSEKTNQFKVLHNKIHNFIYAIKE